MSGACVAAPAVKKVDEVIKQLEREVTCQFCLGAYDDPRILECLHVYCKDCIIGMRLVKMPNRYKCPQCSDHVVIYDVEKLPSFNIARLKQNNLKVLKRLSQQVVLCALCSNSSKNPRNAVYICTDCSEEKQFLCEECSKQHWSRPEFKNHNLDLVTSFSSFFQVSSHNRKSKCLPVCDMHGYQLRYYCQACNTAICHDCWGEYHSTPDHLVYETDNAMEHAKSLIMLELPVIFEVQNSLRKSVKPIQDAKGRVSSQKDFLICEIESRFSRIRKEIDISERVMKEQLQSMTESKKVVLQRQLGHIQEMIEKADRLINLMTQSSNLPDDTSLLSTMDLFLQKSIQLKEEYKEYQTNTKSTVIKQQQTVLMPCESADLAICLPQEHIKHVLRENGKIYRKKAYAANCTAYGPGLLKPQALKLTYFSIQLCDELGNRCYSFQDVQVSINLLAVNGKVKERANVTHRGQGNFTVSFCPRMPGVCDIRVAVNEEDIQDFILLSQRLQQPSIISVNSTGKIFIGDQSQITIVDINANITSAFITSSDNTVNDKCGGIAIDTDNNVYITSLKYHCLTKYTPDGQLIKKVGQKGSQNNDFNFPMGLTIFDGRLFVCDSLNNRIMVYDLDLLYDTCIMLDYTNLNHDRLKQPSQPLHVVFNTNALIFICDSANSCILALTSQQRLRSIFWQTTGLATELCSPRGLALDKDGYLYVSDTDNRQIAVFNSETYECVTTLGCNEIDAPSQIAADNNGMIFVCNATDFKIHVIEDTSIKTLIY
jgi:hypothetical protein